MRRNSVLTIKNVGADTVLTAKLEAELRSLMKTLNYTAPTNANEPREAAPAPAEKRAD